MPGRTIARAYAASTPHFSQKALTFVVERRENRHAPARLATKMTEADVDRFLAAYASAAEGVDVNFRWRPQLTAPKDELVLEAAVNGQADALVTHNVRDFRTAAARFGLRVLLPREMLKELER